MAVLHKGAVLFFLRYMLIEILAARNALKRKKEVEHSLEQTNGQINMLEQQIYSIESANINQETLVAMKNAGAAMKQIHGKMTMEDVDVTMYVQRGYIYAGSSRQIYYALVLHHLLALLSTCSFCILHPDRFQSYQCSTD